MPESLPCLCLAGVVALGIIKANNARTGVHEDVDENAPKVDEAMVSSTNDLAGFRVIQNLGTVRGLTVRSRGIVGNTGASFQAILGGNITLYSSMCDKARSQAYNVMLAHAAEKGANGIVGFRFDANEISQGITEVLAYGTAVKVEPISQTDRIS